MSEKLLSNACVDCPLRKIINCDNAEVMKVLTNERTGFVEYELSDKPNEPLHKQLRLQPMEPAALNDEADRAAQSYDVDASLHPTNMDKFLKRFYYVESMKHKAGKARYDSLLGSLAAAVTECPGPIVTQGLLFRRKQCGVKMMAAVMPSFNMQVRQTMDEEVKARGMSSMLPWHEEKYKQV